MRLKKIFVITLSFILLYLPVVPVTASSAAGKMFTKGNAKINGVAAPQVTSVFSGDRIATEKETTTSLSFSGGDTVVISEMSKAALADSDARTIVRLEDGTVSALNKSPNPVVIEAHGARILPALNQAAIYDVILRGNSLRVVARGGVTRVETANKSADLQPGTELDATLAPPDPAPAASAGLSSAETWIIVGAAAAGATGLILGAIALHKVDNCHLSPSKDSIIC
jgi:hypothetical protein